jgi:hypothetical protein
MKISNKNAKYSAFPHRKVLQGRAIPLRVARFVYFGF